MELGLLGRLAAVAIALGLSGCTDAAPEPPDASTEQLSDVHAGFLAFADCLRSQGIDLTPPRFDGDEVVRWIDLSVALDPVLRNRAASTCQKELADLDALAASGPEQAFIESARRFAGCMRRHGIENFPNPTREGLILEGSGIDPNTKAFVRAERRCGPIFQEDEQ